MSLQNILKKLKDLKVTIAYQEGRLKLSAPKGVLTPGLLKEINENKSRLIEILKERENKAGYASLLPVEKKDYYALGPAQKRLFILHQMESKSTGYNMPRTILLGKDIDTRKLENSLTQLIARHESLRTSFHIMDEEQVQKIHEGVEPDIRYYPAKEEGEAKRIIEDFVRPFDLSLAPLIRAGLVGTREHNILLVDMHHIISDGVSHQILEEEFIKLYNGETLPELPVQYKDYTQWQNSTQQHRNIIKQEEYWLNTLSGELPVLDIPTDFERPTVQSYEGDSIDFRLNKNRMEKLNLMLNKTGVTLYMVLLSIYTILLSKWSGQEDIIVGAPIAGRRHFDLEKLIGMFVNSLVMRNFPTGGKTFYQFLEDVKERTLGAYENQEYPFEDIVEKLSIQRDTGRNPIFNVVFNFFDNRENLDKKDFSALEKNEGNRYTYHNKSTKFDLILRAMDRGDHIIFNFEYSTRLFKRETIEWAAGYFKQITDNVTANPEIKISDIDIISDEVKTRKLNEFNRDLREKEPIKPIQAHLYQRFQESGDCIAIEYGHTRLTYRELEIKAQNITRWLMTRNIKQGRFVGIYLDHKIEFISAIIGILNAGCVFVPLDPQLPEKRIEAMIASAGIQIIFTDTANFATLSRIREHHPDIQSLPVIDPSFHDPQEPLSQGAQSPEPEGHYHIVKNTGDIADNNIYVYFTSGTEGVPNAVLGKNRSLVQFIRWEIDTFRVDKSFRVSQLSGIGFDAFLRNLFTPLLAGATLCIPSSPDLVKDGPALAEWLDTSAVNLVHCVPSVFYQVINWDRLSADRFKRLKYVLLSGEQINPQQLKRWYDVLADRVQLVNCYGATETTVIKTFHLIQRSDSQRRRIPVGLPMRGAQAIVLDRYMNICHQGITGELYIRTPYVTQGYLNNPALTTERFINNPFGSDETDKIYKTGDLARESENREIEILGRTDRQIKIRGARIEPESIENILLKHDQICEATVTGFQDNYGENALCAYVVCRDNAPDEFVRTVKTSPRSIIDDLDSLPIPDRSCVDYEKYTRYIGQSLVKNSITMLGSRGCPFGCAYCHKIWPKKQLSRSAQHIFEELLHYYNIGFRRFVFLDDVFNLDVKNTRRFFALILDNNLDVQLCMNLRGDILTKEYIDLMVKTGVIRMAFALETGSPRLQKLIGKHLNLKKFKENMDYISQTYPQVILEINTMHGFPSETPEEARMTLDFIKGLKWVHFAYINILKIYPNTEMERLALEHGVSRKAIDSSAALAYHQLPETLPFDKSFTLQYQLEFMSDYFLLKERLLHVLPYQLKVLTEDEIVQKYNSYLPVEIRSLADLLKFAEIDPYQLNLDTLERGNTEHIPDLNGKLKEGFPAEAPEPDALRILLLDVTQFFSSRSDEILYDVVEAPLGLMYLTAYLKQQYGSQVHCKIAKSRIDFDGFSSLKTLLEEFKPQFIGIRALTYFKDFFHRTAAMIRQWGIDTPIVAGGPYATSDYPTLLQDRNIDLAVIGEGELTLGHLIGQMIKHNGHLPDEGELRTIPGLALILKEVNDESSLLTGSTMQRAHATLDQCEDMDLASELRRYVSDHLPAYMIPTHFVPLENIPLTPNGKIDRKALPEPGLEAGTHLETPVNEIEKKMVEIWSEVLNIDKDKIGMNSNFFQLGGHSLKATILISKIHKHLDARVPLAEIFKTQTAGGLARYIVDVAPDLFKPIEATEKRDYYELSNNQRRLYAIQMMEPASTAYNMPVVIPLAGTIDASRVEETFKKLIWRHESLRTSFVIKDEKPIQRIHDDVAFAIRYDDAEFVRPFDLSRAPLIRVALVTADTGKNLLVDMHHIISDGTSQALLLGEFNTLFNDGQLPPPTLQYKDYSQWQTSKEWQYIMLKQQAYWLEVFAIRPPVLDLPTDFPRPLEQDLEGATVSFQLSDTETSFLKELSEDNQCTLFMTLAAIYNVLLSKLSGQQDIVIGTPVEGRRHNDLRQVIGMFANTIACRNYPQEEKTFQEFLLDVKTSTLHNFENQEYPFDVLVNQVDFDRQQGRNPLFDVFFNMLNQSENNNGNPEYKQEIEYGTAKFDIALKVYNLAQKLAGTIEYRTSLFKEDTIRRFIDYFKEIIAALVKDRNVRIVDIRIAYHLVASYTDVNEEDFLQFNF
jgi:amino acid adenylation domain-containing protein